MLDCTVVRSRLLSALAALVQLPAASGGTALSDTSPPPPSGLAPSARSQPLAGRAYFRYVAGRVVYHRFIMSYN